MVMGLLQRSSLAFASLALAASAPERPLPFTIVGDRTASIMWGRTFVSPNDDWVNELIALRGGLILGVGFLNRRDGSPPSDWTALATVLTDKGERITENSYGAGGGLDAFFAAREAADGRHVLAGFTTRIGGGGINGYFLLAEPDGAIIKENAFGGNGYDRFTDIAETVDGYLFVGHSMADGEPVKRRVYIVKTDRDGVFEWEKIHEAPETLGALNIEPAGDGGYVIAGGTTVCGDGDNFVMKIDAEGRELWRRRAGTPGWDEVNHGLLIRPDGTIILPGYAHRRGEEANDLLVVTLSPDGEVRRIERFGGIGDDRAIQAKLGRDGGIWIIGHSSSARDGGGTDLLLARVNPDGAFDPGAISIGGAEDDHGTALLPLADGSLLLAGYSRGLGGGGQDAFVVRVTAPAWDRPNPAFTRAVVKAP